MGVMHPVFQCFNGLAPNGVPKGIPVTFDFSILTGSPSYTFDLLTEEQQGGVEFIQGVYVDNSANANSVTLTFSITGQKLVVPPISQGIYPVIAPNALKVSIATTQNAGLSVAIILLNVPMAFSQWGPITLNVANVNPSQTTFTNRSGSIAAGGTSQQLAAGNSNRKILLIENPATAAGQGIAAAESLFVRPTGNAGVNNGTSYEITPGGYWPPAGVNVVSTDQWNVVAATTGHQYIAYEG